jgi:glucosyl-dolichyl phosphate glucuronosyltransferase
MALNATTRRPVQCDGAANDGSTSLEDFDIASTQLSVSVLIATKNRPDELVKAVHSVLQQTSLPMELLILDQSLDDRGQCVVEGELACASSKVKATVRVQHIIDPAISGTAMARNRLLDIAHGSIALFIDDDSVLEPDFIEQIIACYASHPGIAGVGGLITNYSRPRWTERVWPSIFFRGPFHDERQPLYWNAQRLRHADPIRVHRFTGAAMSFRTASIRNIRFDSNLTGNSREDDADFCAMLEPQMMVIAPKARLVHNRSPIDRARDHWLREKAQSLHYLYNRHWNSGLKNRACFWWLLVGYCSLLPLACIRRLSLEPWHGFRAGTRRAMALAHQPVNVLAARKTLHLLLDNVWLMRAQLMSKRVLSGLSSAKWRFMQTARGFRLRENAKAADPRASKHEEIFCP